jgi:hypothetical protein
MDLDEEEQLLDRKYARKLLNIQQPYRTAPTFHLTRHRQHVSAENARCVTSRLLYVRVCECGETITEDEFSDDKGEIYIQCSGRLPYPELNWKCDTCEVGRGAGLGYRTPRYLPY